MREHSGRSAVQGALVLVLALVLPIAASAENEGEIRGHIISINRLYEALEYELALGQVKLARQLPRSTDDEVTLSLYEGIILCEMGKQDLGASLFRAALLLRPGAKLPVQVAPKVNALFESVRTQVKQEAASILPSSGTEKPSTTPEQERFDPPASASTGLAVEKREETKGALQPSEPGSAEAAQKKAEPDADQPIKLSDCGPKPARVSNRSVKERQLWQLANVQHELCLRGKFHGPVSEKWMRLKALLEDATTSHERTRISLEIDQFAGEFLYEDQQRKAELLEARRLETERLEAEQLKVKQLEAERLEAKRLEAEQLKVEQPEAELSSEWLMQQLLRLQGKLLQGDIPSKRVPLRELDKIGQQIRAAHTTESLQEAAHALDDWQQRHLSVPKSPPQQAEAVSQNIEEGSGSTNPDHADKTQTPASMDSEELSSEWLMKRRLRLQGKFLQGESPSKQVPLRELDKIGQQIRVAHTTEALQEAAHALDAWQQKHLTR